jgi:hypothetical protein
MMYSLEPTNYETLKEELLDFVLMSIPALPLRNDDHSTRGTSSSKIFQTKNEVRLNCANIINKGFHYHGTIILIENIHTTSSMNESSEYIHIYRKDIA